METPMTSDLLARNFSLSDLLVEGGPRDLQIDGEVLDRQDFA